MIILVSRLAPWSPGTAQCTSRPGLGATPHTPTMGVRGRRMVSEKWANPSRMGMILVSGSVIRAPRTPRPFEVTMTPCGPNSMARISTHRVSPGMAPWTAMGPTEQSIMEMSMSGRLMDGSVI